MERSDEEGGSKKTIVRWDRTTEGRRKKTSKECSQLLRRAANHSAHDSRGKQLLANMGLVKTRAKRDESRTPRLLSERHSRECLVAVRLMGVVNGRRVVCQTESRMAILDRNHESSSWELCTTLRDIRASRFTISCRKAEPWSESVHRRLVEVAGI